VPVAEIDAWCRDFVQHAPGGGETVGALLQRVRGFDAGAARIVVTHGGWLSAAAWWAAQGDSPPTSDEWPPAPAHGRHTPVVILSAA
jgi:alpha-ribazole phosphatase